MKILYLCTDAGIPVLGRKGASVHVRDLIAAFTRAGHQVVLAAPVLNKSPWETPQPVAATVLQLKLGGAAQTSVQAVKQFTEMLGVPGTLPGELRRILYNEEMEDDLRRRFDSDPPDFIYERAALYGTSGAALARTFKVPLLLELNAPLAVEQGTYRGSGLGDLASVAERWTLQQADAVLAVSAPLREHVLALGVSAERAHVFPNGVDPALFHPAGPDPLVRARLGLGEGPVLGFVGGLRPWHGIEALPELVARLAPKYPGLRLVIAGDGQLRGDLERGLKERGVAERVVFTGALVHAEVPGVVRQFDVALAPYPKLDHDFYFSPLKVFEYMACGVAVVAARCGQIAEVIRSEENGVLYPPGDLDALTAACDRLLGSANLRLALGRAAAELVQASYTWDHNAQRAAALAQTLIARRRIPG